VTDSTEDDLNRAKGKPGAKPPGREESLSSVRDWLSNEAGFPKDVRIETEPTEDRLITVEQ